MNKIEIPVPEGKQAVTKQDGNRTVIEFVDDPWFPKIRSWWIAPSFNTYTGPFCVVEKIDKIRFRVKYFNGKIAHWGMPAPNQIFPIPPKPDEEAIRKLGYELTGEVREPSLKDYYVGRNDLMIFEGRQTLDAGYFGGRRWIVRKIAPSGLALFQSMVPGDRFAINGVECVAEIASTGILLICPCCIPHSIFFPHKSLGIGDFQRNTGIDVYSVTESMIEWRYKMPR